MQRLIARLMAVLTAALSPLAWATPSLAQAYGDRDVWWHPGWGWGHMIFGGLMMLFFWGGLILLVVLLVRWLGSAGGSGHAAGPAGPAGRRTPLEILQERFAKGEIEKEDYEERKRLLSE
jgi:putative membrane protein